MFFFFHGRVVTVTSLLEIGFYLLLLIQVEKMVNSLSRFCESLFTFVSHRKGMNNILIKIKHILILFTCCRTYLRNIS